MASQFGGIEVPEEEAQLQSPSKFGGIPVLTEEAQPQSKSKFGGEPVLAAPVIPAPVIPAPVTPAPEVEGNLLRETLDIPLKLGSGVLTGTKMVTDVFGADNAVSSGLGAAEEWLSNLVSAQSKADSAEIARIMQEAEDLGFMGQAKAALNALTVAPIDFLAQGVGTFVPAIAAAIGGTRRISKVR